MTAPSILPEMVDLPPTEAKIFHGMWAELARLGRLPSAYGVICPLCVLPKSHEELTLEHIIPQRALRRDPESLRGRHHLNHRSGLTLLCRSCNGLKGQHYDPVIEVMFRYPKAKLKPHQEKLDLKARRTLGYLAAFRELGYAYILSSDLDAVRLDFLNPIAPPITTGINLITAGFERQLPHAYFDGWCDTFDETGNRITSVFSCHCDPYSDTIQVRARHISVTLPAGKPKIIVPRKPGSPPNIGLNASLM
jgi:hypothetical protein